MPQWFLSTRAHSVGGPVGPVKILDADRPGHSGDLTRDLLDAIRGREIFLGVHGFNVNQKNGIAHLTDWFDNMQIGTAVPIGILWPGDCILPIFVDYIFEGNEAIQSGKLLAAFLNTNFTGAVSLCFASHSLGARVVLQTIDGLAQSFRIRRTLLMAGAIDNNCLTAEYSAAANKIDEISILASTRDDVLALAYPLGSPLQGIIDRGHPYYHEALGREGPAEPSLSSPRLQPDWQIPENLDYGHLDYLPDQPILDAFPLPVDIPPDNGPDPPADTPLQLVEPKQWKPAWSAAFASSRYK
jgi:hypothetical protein